MSGRVILVLNLVSNLLALGVLALSLRRRLWARAVLSALFIWASQVNFSNALLQPWVYLGYARLPGAWLYRDFILGFFAMHTTAIVGAIAAGQLLCGLAIAAPTPWTQWGLGGAIVFLAAIAPLGTGSAFPCTLILALACALLLWDPEPRGVLRAALEGLTPAQRARLQKWSPALVALAAWSGLEAMLWLYGLKPSLAFPPLDLLARALVVWVCLICVETLHGILRARFVAPRVGDMRSRQLAVFTGSVLILAVAFAYAPWLAAATLPAQLEVGALWAGLTIAFDLELGFGLFHQSWKRMASDFDLPHGGLLPFGLVVLALAPFLAWHLR